MYYKLIVFKKVAEKLSFTKAATELFLTQPAVTKHIKSLETELGVMLFNRRGNHIELTKSGEILFDYSKKIEKLHNELIFDLNTLNEQIKGKLRIGSSSTMTQYILPMILADFKSKFNDLSISVMNGNTEQIEKALHDNEIDLGIVEGQTKRFDFQYVKFVKDEIVLVTSSSNKIAKRGEITPDELKTLPLILREDGSGTLEVIAYHLKQKGLNFNDLNIEMRLGSTEAIKNYLLQSKSLAFLSIHSIFKELKKNEFTIIDVANLTINRHFNFILPDGQQNNSVQIFMRFAIHYNF